MLGLRQTRKIHVKILLACAGMMERKTQTKAT